jgi:hypothetical protein
MFWARYEKIYSRANLTQINASLQALPTPHNASKQVPLTARINSDTPTRHLSCLQLVGACDRCHSERHCHDW